MAGYLDRQHQVAVLLGEAFNAQHLVPGPEGTGASEPAWTRELSGRTITGFTVMYDNRVYYITVEEAE